MPDSARFAPVAIEESCESELRFEVGIDAFGMMVTYRRRMTEKRVTQRITKVTGFSCEDRFTQNFAREVNADFTRQNLHGLLK